MDRFLVKNVKLFTTIVLLFVSAFCFAQQPLPSRIDGGIPTVDSPTLYQIQVGAFLYAQNVANTTNRLRGGGVNPLFENFENLTRVIVSQVSANEIISNLERLARLGFDHIIIREDPRGFTISEKWNIPESESRFSSFEFNRDNSFIAIERAVGNTSPAVRFGEYVMPRQNIINMTGLGTLEIESRDEDDLQLSFIPIDKPGIRTALAAVVEPPMPSTPETDMFTRTWRVVNSARESWIGNMYIFSINGTYMVIRPDGSVSTNSHWRWRNEKRGEWDYSHTNWQDHFLAVINTLRPELLIWTEDIGIVELVPVTAGNP